MNNTGFLGLMRVSTHRKIVADLRDGRDVEMQKLQGKLEAERLKVSSLIQSLERRDMRISTLEREKAAVENDLRMATAKPTPAAPKPKAKLAPGQAKAEAPTQRRK